MNSLFLKAACFLSFFYRDNVYLSVYFSYEEIMNTFGRYFRISSFGESHGFAMGVVIDGCPSGVPFSEALLREHLDRRRPGRFPWQTSRKEKDEAQVLSGVFKNKTLGTPIAILVENKNQKSQDYSSIKKNPRAGHADDLWKDKFQHFDYRGGGRASGRETVSRVIGGSVAYMFLKEIYQKFQVLSYATQIGPYELQKEYDEDELWSNSKKIEEFPAYFPHQDSEKIKKMLIQAKKEGQSYGGKATVKIKGVPKGLGQPVFHKLKSDFSSALMSVGSVYGVSIGAEEKSSVGQEFHKQASRVYGGIRGGISTGEIIELQVLFKPPSSLGVVAQKGRHDPCVIPRAIPVLESMVYLVIADHTLAKRLDQVNSSIS